MPKRARDGGWTTYLKRIGLNSTTAWRYIKLAEYVDLGRIEARVSKLHSDRYEAREIIEGVYFVQGVDGGLIKIGESGDVISRLRDLQACSPAVLRLIGVLEITSGSVGRQGTERAWHQKFADHRRHGEWFAPVPEPLAAIATHTKGEK
jgi:hypothetical protein